MSKAAIDTSQLEFGWASSRPEFITWLIILANYLAWLLLLWHQAVLPWWLLMMAGGYVICLHGSLQHECLHGHPTNWNWLNKFLAWAPLGLWMPYTIYRDSHIAHHGCGRLTDPLEDPESFYISADRWRSFAKPMRFLFTVNNSLAGRLLLGPVIAIAGFWIAQVRMLWAGDTRYAGVWCWHVAGIIAVLFYVMGVCQMPLWQYLLFFVWPGLSLTLLRSYTEHRPGEEQALRTTIIEGSWLTRLLYLNNNYHFVHHADPGLPWVRIKPSYDAHRLQINAANGGFYYRNYAEIFRRHLFSPKDCPRHPAV